jgi:hypothetical protein
MTKHTIKRMARNTGMAGLALLLGGAATAEDISNRLAAVETRLAAMEREAAATTPSLPKLGGYGELHYNNLSGEGGAADKEEIDFHRFVLFLGHEFTDRIRFRSELELEHAVSGGDEPGEVELEQAYVDADITDRHGARAGLFLVPVGLLNTTHEPPRFYGVERNPVENAILPTTWREAGAGLYGDLGAGFGYEAYVHGGMNVSTGSQYAVRDGRQGAASADASALAATLALKWSAPGITLGGAVHHQSDIAPRDEGEADAAWLGEVHADVRRGPVGLRALYAEWALEGDGPAAVGADRQQGWYVEPSYRLARQVGVFARYASWNNLAGLDNATGAKSQTNVGINYWPHDQVVVKADYQWQDYDNGKNQDGVNLGVGYEF